MKTTTIKAVKLVPATWQGIRGWELINKDGCLFNWTGELTNFSDKPTGSHRPAFFPETVAAQAFAKGHNLMLVDDFNNVVVGKRNPENARIEVRFRNDHVFKNWCKQHGLQGIIEED